MDLKTLKKYIDVICTSLSVLIVCALLIWPPIHMIAAKTFHFSTWRLFGWGMYANPNPQSQSRLRVVVLDNTDIDLKNLHTVLTQSSSDPEQESMCINMFAFEHNHLRKLPRNGLCKDDRIAREFDLFLHFSSIKNLSVFTKEALHKIEREHSPAIVFLTHQRMDLLRKKTFVESDAYKFASDKVVYLGKIKNET